MSMADIDHLPVSSDLRLESGIDVRPAFARYCGDALASRSDARLTLFRAEMAVSVGSGAVALSVEGPGSGVRA
jgi:hypothetical protein